MKVCQIVYTGFGGLGSVAFSLLAGMPAGGPRLTIAFIGDQPIEPTYAARCEALGIEYAVFEVAAKRRLSAWRRLARWLARTGPDVVICHSLTSILAAGWYARRHSARLIAVEHTPNHLKTRNERLASRMAMLLADRVVVLTEEYTTELRQAHGFFYRPEKVRVIPNGIDVAVFRPCELGSTEPAVFRIGMAGRFSFSKRQELLVEAFARLHEICPGVAFELSLAGDGSELERVKTSAARSPVGARVRFEGFLDEGQLADWFRQLDLYVHATDGETLSTSLLQAMASRLAIVASDVPGVRNLLSGHDYGCCVPNDADSFARATAALVTSGERRRAMGEAGRARIVESYSVQQMSKAYLMACEG